jgi:hypothetical protein
MGTTVADFSRAQQIAQLPEYDRNLVLAGLSKEQLLALQYDWHF